MLDDSYYKDEPTVLVYGDNEKQDISRVIWSMISCQGVRIVRPETPEDLEKAARECVMIFMGITGPDDPKCALGEALHDNCRVVSEIIAVTGELPYETQMAALARGFDNVFTLGTLEKPDFRVIINNKICKGRVRLRGRMQDEEYQRFRAALDVSPDAFIVFDEDKNLFFASEHYKRAYPKNAGNLVRGVSVYDCFDMLSAEHNVHPGDHDYELMRKFWHSLEGQIEFTDKTGRAFRISAGKMPDGRGTIVSTTDITEYLRQKEMLESKSAQLSEALRNEQEASALQKQFIDMISHEFRTPLTIIDGNAQYMLRRPEKLTREELARRCKTVRSAVQRLIQLMEGLLSSNMAKTGRLLPEPEHFDLGALISELVGEYEDLEKGYDFEFRIENLPQNVLLDKKLTTLILTNLLTNAVKYTRDAPRISVSASHRNDHIVLEVEDNGVGIPQQEQGSVFDRFYRASTSAGIPGTGIGLNLTRDLVEIQGGKISLWSEVGFGSRFTVHLPLSLEGLQVISAA